MSALTDDQLVALASLACAVVAGTLCAYAARPTASNPNGVRERLLWAVAGLIALLAFPLIGSAV